MKIEKINNKIIKNVDLLSTGISTQSYCYHKNLSIAGNCRIRLIELKNSNKPVVVSSFIKRIYSTTNKKYAMEFFETYVHTVTSLWPYKDLIHRLKVLEVGIALDKATGISQSQGFEVLNECLKDKNVCSYYVSEIAKSPDLRNLTTKVVADIKSSTEITLTYDPKTGNIKPEIKTSITVEGKIST